LGVVLASGINGLIVSRQHIEKQSNNQTIKRGL